MSKDSLDILRVHRLTILVQNYLKAGGSPNVPFVDKFCIENGVKKEDLIKVSVDNSIVIQPSEMEKRLKNMGLVP